MNVCLMSIKPKWAKELYSGKKTVEFRKNSPPVGSLVFLYESTPVKAVTGCFIVESIFIGPAYSVWYQCSTAKAWKPGSVRNADLEAYAGGKSATCCAILVMSPWRFSQDDSVLLEKYAVIPPRSWQRLRPNVSKENILAQVLRNRAETVWNTRNKWSKKKRRGKDGYGNIDQAAAFGILAFCGGGSSQHWRTSR